MVWVRSLSMRDTEKRIRDHGLLLRKCERRDADAVRGEASDTALPGLSPRAGPSGRSGARGTAPAPSILYSLISNLSPKRDALPPLG